MLYGSVSSCVSMTRLLNERIQLELYLQYFYSNVFVAFTLNNIILSNQRKRNWRSQGRIGDYYL